MGHPFFKNLRFFGLYMALWATVSVTHFAILWLNYSVSMPQALFDAIVSNLLFCAIGISLWVPLKFYSPDRFRVFNIIINHVTTMSITILIWLGLVVIILKFSSGSGFYTNFLLASLPSRAISGFFYYAITVMAYYLIGYNNDIQEKLSNEGRLKDKIREAELNMLKSQINPHFLFNSLNSISFLTISDPPKAQEMVIKLSDFMRYSVSQTAHNFTSLHAELENIRRYLEIEQIRFGDKLQFDVEVKNQCLEAQLPAMILQPLYENAVKHGVYDSLEAISIRTECSCDHNFLYLKIWNNMDTEKSVKKGNGIGLRNISERLKLIYQTDGLIITRSDQTWFEVQVSFPQLQNQ